MKMDEAINRQQASVQTLSPTWQLLEKLRSSDCEMHREFHIGVSRELAVYLKNCSFSQAESALENCANPKQFSERYQKLQVACSSFHSRPQKIKITLSEQPFSSTLGQTAARKFAELSIDRCFKSIDKSQEPADYLAYCLRYRTHLSLNQVSAKCGGRRRMSADLKPKDRPICLYDSLLNLLQDHEPAGRVEIFRLLMERRCPVPLILADREHHLSLLRLLNLDGKSSVGEDMGLMRVAIISGRDKNRSQTAELMKEVFKIESLHLEDASMRCYTTLSTTMDIGLGHISSPAIGQYLILHVFGDFEPFWNFIDEFADYLVVEDSPERNFVERVPHDKLKDTSVTVWRPTAEELTEEFKDLEHFSFYCVESAMGTRLYNSLVADIQIEEKRWRRRMNQKNILRKPLYQFQLPQMLGVNCSVRFVNAVVSKVADFGTLRQKSFVLQRNFCQQAQYEEKKSQFRNETDKIIAMDREISKLKLSRQREAPAVEKHPLIHLLKLILGNADANIRILGTVQLDKALAARCDALLPSLRSSIDQLSAELAETLLKRDSDARSVQKRLHEAKKKYNQTIVGSEHIWREVSHIYAATKQVNYPQMAAQHLIDGMCVELLDGDANLINISWIEATLKEVDRRLGQNGRSPRIFVLSIMGMQSSGKSTLLNIMFGIQMKTSVGQCTRGINMQLIRAADRKEYDYVLLLDTEGTRAPEYWGLPGSEKRDNQMATISILLADATIIVNSGENDAAVKEILPIVLLAYQGSELAEEKGGQMSSMLFFVYNRIDTREKDKLSNILQVLGTSLHEAFKTAYQLSGDCNVPATSRLFQRFRLDSSNSADSDVRILGNTKKGFHPPEDVPDSAYGEALAEFRQHIHDRVTGSSKWKSRTLVDFLTYLNLVWKCIQSADFNLNFKSVIERASYDQMNVEIKSCERQLSEEYKTKFAAIEKEILMSDSPRADGVDMEHFKRQLVNQVQSKRIELDEQMKEVLTKPSRDKWQISFQEMWESFKKEQENQWNGLLEKFINYQLKFDYWTDQLKRKMRQRIRDVFQDENSRNGTQKEKDQLFDALYEEILEMARDTQPTVDVEERVNGVYRKNPLIQCLPTEVFDLKAETEADYVIEDKLNGFQVAKRRKLNYISELLEYAQSCLTRNSERTRTVYDELFNQINSWIEDKHCYVDSIVDEVINITQSVIVEKRFLHHKEQKAAHIFAKQLIIRFMTEIQADWERKNSIYARLSSDECRQEMRTYFDEASRGVVDTRLFIVMLQCNFQKVLAEAFEEEMILLTMGKVSSKNWLLDPKAMLNHMDVELLELIDRNQIERVLGLVKQSRLLYEIVIRKLIDRECPNLRDEWTVFCGRVKRAIDLAAAAASEFPLTRARRFIMELQRQGFQNGFRDNFLAKKFTTDSDGYEGCDNEEAEVFHQHLSALAEFIDEIPLDPGIELSTKVLNRLREERTEEGARPRCNEACPLCQSLCILPYGHGTAKKHETFHQPQGLTGWRWETPKNDVNYRTLCECNCTSDHAFWYKRVWHVKRDFVKLFPDWMHPTFTENFPLREFIFAKFNKRIARYYRCKPCRNIPADYFHNLEEIRADLKAKTNSQ